MQNDNGKSATQFLIIVFIYCTVYCGVLILLNCFIDSVYYDESLVLLSPLVTYAAFYQSRYVFLSTMVITFVYTMGTLSIIIDSSDGFYQSCYTVTLVSVVVFLSSELVFRVSAYRRKIDAEREKLIAELQKALKDVKTLSKLLPICSHCKNIRNDQGYWEQIETYITEHSGTKFSHGICPNCAKKYYPDIPIYDPQDSDT